MWASYQVTAPREWYSMDVITNSFEESYWLKGNLFIAVRGRGKEKVGVKTVNVIPAFHIVLCLEIYRYYSIVFLAKCV